MGNLREDLKEQLKGMVAGVGAGIDINTPHHWVIEGLQKPIPFFTQLQNLIPPDAILYFEGTGIAPEVGTFYLANEVQNSVAVIRDTIAPEPDIYHVKFSQRVIEVLCQFTGKYANPELFDHIKAYQGQTLLFTFHDAFCGWLRISEAVPEQTVAAFCEALGTSYRREETKQRDYEQLRLLLWAFENPDKVKVRGAKKAWYSRLWSRLFGK
jgi:hypothetical protein